MKRIYKILIGAFLFTVLLIITVACTSQKEVYTEVPDDTSEDVKLEKSGAQLWGETCNRCHLAPSPADFNDTDWATISMHMRIRANLADAEIKKIQEFLQSAN